MRWCALAACLLLPAWAEELRYSVNWPSGLSLGEAVLEIKPVDPSRTEARMTIDASLPGFAIVDRFRSVSGPRFCSAEFDKSFQHGPRKGSEKLTFEASGVRRQTTGGGTSSVPVPGPGCGRDALAFLLWLSSELRDGRLPPEQTIFFGAPYRIALRFQGPREVTVSDRKQTLDCLQAAVRGPASQLTFDLYFSQDRAKRLVMAKVPFALGSFSMELVD